MTASFNTIPLFDMSEFLSPYQGVRQSFVSRLRQACHEVGFFYIQNHGVSPTLMQEVLALAAAFFDLPQTLKDSLQITASAHYRGYGRLEAEITQGIPDFKETYDFGLEQAARETEGKPAYHILQGPNQWPEVTALQNMHWKEKLLEYIAASLTAGKQLMQAIALTLDLPLDYFADRFSASADDAYAILRLLRYPPNRATDNKAEPRLGVGAHTDAGCLVMLLQDQTGGLQVQNCKGEWIDAPPIPGTHVVNIGEMLQHWSNNYFVATPHRVINTSSTTRYSAPIFLEPGLGTRVEPLALSSQLKVSMQRPLADPNKSVIYGEHILAVYQRSFPEN